MKTTSIKYPNQWEQKDGEKDFERKHPFIPNSKEFADKVYVAGYNKAIVDIKRLNK